MTHPLRSVIPNRDGTLALTFSDGTEGVFDVNPYLVDEALEELKNVNEFMKVHNGGYYIAWDCGADLSADTLRARARIVNSTLSRVVV